ncbi:trypsin-like serine protease [Spiribacter insolitus]|uniref:Trypsin-like serine protease n=1 Tax=Spiribacter insolitus TaxID=3122417 RepID=A0ABV3T3T3_9GAMM
MPTTADSLQAAERRALREDGVVYVRTGDVVGSGALLYDGRAVLTAGHVVDAVTRVGDLSVQFDTESGRTTRQIDEFIIHPEYDWWLYRQDLALLWLAGDAPADATRYVPYRDSDELGQTVSLVGYGDSGTGNDGTLPNTIGARRLVENRLDADAQAIDGLIGGPNTNELEADERFLIDFDNGLIANDALGQLIDMPGLGLGDFEGMVAPGDSGGPALIEGEIAGVANAIASLSDGAADPDVDDVLNASFGEIGVLQRVSTEQQWIDQSLRARYPDAPQSPGEVSATVVEGDSGITYAYFMLQFTGERETPDQLLSVRYRTEDGTAKAGEDYIATQGKLILYPGEREGLIPVEVIGDTITEPDETFSLTVYDPIGGSFGEGVSELTATRLITDDDGMMV